MNLFVVFAWVINLCVVCGSQDIGYLKFMAVLGCTVIIMNCMEL